MTVLYNFFISAYILGIRVASLWNKKAKEWLTGRENVFDELAKKIGNNLNIIWVHCSSAGEFEQAKPIIESLKEEFPGYNVLVSFFSPSGYNTAKNYSYADFISYLPVDSLRNAKRFVGIVQPKMVIFVKYDLWYHYLSVVSINKIPLLLVSAVFRKNQVFFKFYGSFYRKMLLFFNHVFVQDEDSLSLLKSNGIDKCSISGDTRFDRVTEISQRNFNLENIKKFKGDQYAIVAGSTWLQDEKLLSKFMETTDLKLILAPHEINETHLKQIEGLFNNSVRYSQLKEESLSKKILIIDNVGMLSQLYRQALIAYVGGGFSKDGIHNILEAAVYGKPVIFGPNYKKYREAKELIAQGGAFSITGLTQLKNEIKNIRQSSDILKKTGWIAQHYVKQNTGATKNIIHFIHANRLLTNW